MLKVSRRDVLAAGVAAGLAAAVKTPLAMAAEAAAAAGEPILRAIPSSGERLPVVGVGTNAFGVTDPAQLASLREVLAAMPGLGGRMIDTARSYGSSELVIGQLLAELGNRERFFLATKAPMRGEAPGIAALDESLQRLQVQQVDLMYVHNFGGFAQYMPLLAEYRQAGKTRYIGCTTSEPRQYPQMIDAIQSQKMDVIQVNYSIDNRAAAERILPLAREKGIAVVINMPFGGLRGSFFSRVANRPLPDFAQEIGATSWAQFFLKYILANPAVTAGIPGTTTMQFLHDNLAGGRGVVPDAAMARRMEAFWDALPA